MSGDLLNSLIILSEKAANIARICRQDKHLLSLLVQEKSDEEKNPRFVHDFKTFADVLVQEVIKYHIETNFPNLKGNILGEETNTFKKGDTCITVEVKKTESETEQLLYSVLQDKVAAEILSKEVHNHVDSASHPKLDYVLPDNLAMWIDPIDSTAEYIQGKEGSNDGISRCGVRCVTVLIGVFSKDSGRPLLGVVNQPFYSLNEDNKWSGRCFYGISNDGLSILEPALPCDSESKVVVLSSSEKENVKNCLLDGGYSVLEVAGAGYKGLTVVTGAAQAYILSQGSTYPWDICAVHTLLCAAGGGIVDFKNREPLIYSDQPKPNSDGLIAYRDSSTLENLITLFDKLS